MTPRKARDSMKKKKLRWECSTQNSARWSSNSSKRAPTHSTSKESSSRHCYKSNNRKTILSRMKPELLSRITRYRSVSWPTIKSCRKVDTVLSIGDAGSILLSPSKRSNERLLSRTNLRSLKMNAQWWKLLDILTSCYSLAHAQSHLTYALCSNIAPEGHSGVCCTT